MEIMLVGGQYDGEWVNVDVDEYKPPMPVLNMPEKLERLTTARWKDVGTKETFDLLHYKLERVKTSAKNWRYEYHYQGH